VFPDNSCSSDFAYTERSVTNFSKMPISDWNFHTPGPVPPVQPDDIENALAVILPIRRQEPGPGAGISATLFADRCDPASNLAAVGTRAMLVEVALKAGLLDKWRLEGDRLDKRVYEVAALYPLSLEGLDLGDCVQALEQRPGSA